MKKYLITFLIGLLLAVPKIPSHYGIIIIDPTTKPQHPIVPLEVKYHRVNVTITGQVAITNIDEVFVNPNDMDLEGTFIFPLPDGASITDFSLYIDGKEVKGEVLSADEARKTYEDIVRALKDPALLEYMDRNLFKLRVYPIPARGERRIELTYSETLKYDFGTVKYTYPLDTEKYSSAPLKEVTIDTKIKSKVPIKGVYSPSHDIDISRTNSGEVRLSYEENNVLPDKDFVLYYTLSGNDVDASLITYRERGDSGYFMLLVAPRPDIDPKDVAAKDVTFVVDTSGSMKGEKLDQAKRALNFCINALNPDDRFNVIRFSTDTESFKKELVPATKKTKEEATSFVEDLAARGGTNINDALISALKGQDNKKRPHIVVFMTDGEPTTGETDFPDIIRNVEDANDRKAKIFVFGIGEEINTHLLDNISKNNHGASDYVTPTEDIEEVISNFFVKISSPAMSDINIDFSKVAVSDFYPEEGFDLFSGSQITMVGRYRGSGNSTILLKGMIGDREVVFEYPAEFPERDTENNFLPRIWATRKIAYLLDEIRLNGENKELVDEISEIAKKFGIVTPYTSFLVLEDEKQGFEGFAPGAAEDVTVMSEPRLFTEESGGFALKSAEKMRDLKETDKVSRPDLMSIKQVGERTFFLRDEIWIDSEYKEGTKTKDISYDGRGYWDLVRKSPDVGRFFALGKKVIFIYEGIWYRIN